MKKETSSAVDFVANLLRTGVTVEQYEFFRETLLSNLLNHYEGHWFPEKPFKGSGYRCIRINQKMDPSVAKAASIVGVSPDQLARILPSELTLWVDPDEVSYRIGEDGSIGILYGEENKSDDEICSANSPVSSDEEISNQGLTSSSSSASSSPSPANSPNFYSMYGSHYSNQYFDQYQPGFYMVEPVLS